MNQSENINEIAKALAAAQATLTNPAKNKTAKAGSYSYKYADIADVLDCVRPVLSKQGIAVTQPTEVEGDILMVQTRLSHSSGQWMSSNFPVCRINGDHQKMGAALTYAKRYALSSLVGVAADDDNDGAGAAPAEAPAKRTMKEISAAKKGREDEHDTFIRELDEVQSLVALDRFEKAWGGRLGTDGGHMWTMQERLEAKRRELSEPVEEHDSETGELPAEPQTRAQYVQACHDKIETFTTKPELAKWWTGEAMARRRFSLNPTEVDDLKERVVKQQRAIEAAPIKDKSGRELHPMEAG